MKDELLMIDENITSVSDALNKGALAFLESCSAHGKLKGMDYCVLS